MPEINSIPYENAEDLNKFLYDNYYSSENLDSTTTGTGFVGTKIFELEQSTGVTQNSKSLIYYNQPIFNPLYSEAVWKCYLNSMDDCFLFFGFKETTTDPMFDLKESHAAFMINEGKLYASVGDGATQQRVEIVGIDMTRIENFKIEYNKFYIQPLPVAEEVLSMPGILTTFPEVKRTWKLMTQLSNYPPINQNHYIVQFIKNSVNADKIIKFRRFIYREVYAD